MASREEGIEIIYDEVVAASLGHILVEIDRLAELLCVEVAHMKPPHALLLHTLPHYRSDPICSYNQIKMCLDSFTIGELSLRKVDRDDWSREVDSHARALPLHCIKHGFH